MTEQTLPDIHPQKQKITLTKAGVKGVKIPFISFGSGTVASLSAYVKGLETRGANMSRFARTFHEFEYSNLNGYVVRAIADKLTKMHQSDCTLKIRFESLLPKISPVSQASSWSAYQMRFYLDTELEGAFAFGVDIPISTVCPCSAELTGITGHMQRAVISVDLSMSDPHDCHEEFMKNIIGCCEDQGSGQLYSILRREDEKEVTERMMKKPRFVEDVARGVIEVLKDEDLIDTFSVVIESMESIHEYNVLGIYDSDGVNIKAL